MTQLDAILSVNTPAPAPASEPAPMTPADLEELSLEELSRQVARLRVEHAELKDELQEAKAQWAEEHRDLLNDETATKELLGDAEYALRKRALKTFKDTGEREPTPGVKVQMRTVYRYSEKDARSYAVEHAPDLFSFDAKGFDKLAAALSKAKRPLDFVTEDAEPRITVAKHLPGAPS